ncbi:FAD-binding oxidoreductase [Amnibacterium sp. CER49]|uniref:NAD(P)/FAD-dependent oxidoreductase n=1 Tax=Amnibacterium sp. CER49 TaxID=3039161 RepID=UPI00244D4433|nr:FAD-binding oxidoreductase [Amnibacterium sp. CER49]MDH2443130.1 FAD-binding oxidoreductase [Amnibacterium sp. CER49]
MADVVDIAIVGGGVAGLSLAAALRGRARTVVLETEPSLYLHTSSRSAEQMQPTYGPDAARRLTSASIPLVARIAERLGEPIFTPRPLLWLSYADDRTELEHLLATVPGLTELGAREAVRRLPALRPDLLRDAAVDDSAVEVRVPALLEAYRAAAEAGGVRILLSSPLTRVEQAGERWRLTAGDRTIEAAIVVNAAGAWAERVGALVGGAPRGLVPKRRTVAVVEPTARPVEPGWPMAADAADTFYFRPRGATLLGCVLEDEPSEPEDARPRPDVVARVVARLNAVTDLALTGATSAWTGLRTVAPDGLPVVGRDAEVPGLYWLAGQGGFGIQTSAALGEVVAADLLGVPSGLDGLDGVLEAIRPDRDALAAAATAVGAESPV